MSKRTELINSFYAGYPEDIRLEKSRHGQLEYLTTMHYIHKMLPPNATVLEVGAGTGRYSIALAREGHRVTAVDLVERNLEILRENSKGIDNINSFQGDALDLGRFDDNSYDMTLVLGPMYHLYEKEDQLKAIKEAVRVTKPSGVIMTAFLSVHSIIHDNYLCGNLASGMEENFTKDFNKVKHFTEQVFTGFYIDEFEALFNSVPIDRITTIATDGVLELAEMTNEFSMSDEEFDLYAKYHLNICEKREYLGNSSHLLLVCRKK